MLGGIVGGLTNRKIGDNLGLSESQVKNIIQRLFTKSGVRTRSQLVRAALEASWVPSRGSSRYELARADAAQNSESRQMAVPSCTGGESHE